jgi:hypothetical protein
MKRFQITNPVTGYQVVIDRETPIDLPKHPLAALWGPNPTVVETDITAELLAKAAAQVARKNVMKGASTANTLPELKALIQAMITEAGLDV